MFKAALSLTFRQRQTLSLQHLSLVPVLLSSLGFMIYQEHIQVNNYDESLICLMLILIARLLVYKLMEDQSQSTSQEKKTFYSQVKLKLTNFEEVAVLMRNQEINDRAEQLSMLRFKGRKSGNFMKRDKHIFKFLKFVTSIQLSLNQIKTQNLYPQHSIKPNPNQKSIYRRSARTVNIVKVKNKNVLAVVLCPVISLFQYLEQHPSKEVYLIHLLAYFLTLSVLFALNSYSMAYAMSNVQVSPENLSVPLGIIYFITQRAQIQHHCIPKGRTRLLLDKLIFKLNFVITFVLGLIDFTFQNIIFYNSRFPKWTIFYLIFIVVTAFLAYLLHRWYSVELESYLRMVAVIMLLLLTAALYSQIHTVIT